VPHAPQFDESVATATHLPPHNICPAWLHAHRPDTQVVPPPQAVPQPPQFASSIVGSTHAVPHSA
jgi:hypothetical protein